MLNNVTIIDRKDAMTLEMAVMCSESKCDQMYSSHYSDVGLHIENSGALPIYLPFVKMHNCNWLEYYKQGAIKQRWNYLMKKREFSFGYTTVSKVPENETLSQSFIPEGTYFKATHTGSRKTIFMTYMSMLEWVFAQNFEVANESIEFYSDLNNGSSSESIIVLIPMLE